MRKSIRIYREHDIDLVTLYKNPDFGFQKALKQAVRAYVRGVPYLIYTPVTQDVSQKDFKYGYQIFITFDEEYDADIIEWLKTLKPRSLTKALKSILRGSLIGPIAYGCFKTDNDRKKSDDINRKIKELIESGNLNELISTPPVRKERSYSKKKNNNAKKDTANHINYATSKSDDRQPVQALKTAPDEKKNYIDDNNLPAAEYNKSKVKDKESYSDRSALVNTKPSVTSNGYSEYITKDNSDTNASDNMLQEAKVNDIPAVENVTNNNDNSMNKQEDDPFTDIYISSDNSNSVNTNDEDDDFDLFASADNLINQFM